MSELEAASVFAFERLAEELAFHGAPTTLIDDARAFAADEVRHTAITASLARRFGAEAREPAVGPLPVRNRLAIALENAVEGCVRETFGALQATFQACAAEDAAIARAMRAIADDETRHAALAWRVAAWLEPQLDAHERAQVERARREAVASLERELTCEPGADVVARAGAPRAIDASRLLAGVRHELWAA